VHRQVAGVGGLLVAASGSGLVLLGVALWHGDSTGLAIGPAVTVQLVMAGILLGLGALLNGGCYLSSVSYIGTGNFHYLLTLAGFVIAARYAPAMPLPALELTVALPLAAGLPLFAMVAALALRRIRTTQALPHSLDWRSAWPWPLAALACGIAAAMLNLLNSGWSYSKLLEALATGNRSLLSWSLVLSASAIFVGAIFSSMLAGKFQWPRLSPLKALRCLSGGMLMGYAAAHIPGGNDSLLLWAIPSLALYGLTAYLAMLATISCALVCGQIGARLFSRAS
jgi:toxin CptA